MYIYIYIILYRRINSNINTTIIYTVLSGMYYLNTANLIYILDRNKAYKC